MACRSHFCELLIRDDAESLYRVLPMFLSLETVPVAGSYEALRQAVPASLRVPATISAALSPPDAQKSPSPTFSGFNGRRQSLCSSFPNLIAAEKTPRRPG